MIRTVGLATLLVGVLAPTFVFAQSASESECLVSEGDYYGVKMTRTEAEQAYRRAMRAEFPDLPDQDFESLVQYGMKKQRERVVRKQAACLRIKDKYPNLSQKEREVLVQDELSRYQAADERRSAGVPEPPPGLSCTQMRLGAVSSIDCY